MTLLETIAKFRAKVENDPHYKEVIEQLKQMAEAKKKTSN